ATTALESVSVSGSTALNGASVDTTGTQTYTGPATLGTDVTLTASTVSFGNTLDGTTDFAEDLTLTAGTGNANFNGAVGGTTDLGDVTVTSAASVIIDGPFNANNIAITASDSTININEDVTAAGDLELNNNTTVAAGRRLTADNDLLMGAGKTMTAEGDLSLEATNGGIMEKAGDDGVFQIVMPAGGATLSLTQLDSLDMGTFDVTNAATTELLADSGASITDAEADRWQSIAAAAQNGITLRGTGSITTNTLTSSGEDGSTDDDIVVRSTNGDLIVQGDIRASHGGVALISENGGIYSAAGGVALTYDVEGYSDHLAGLGVVLDQYGAVPENPGLAAIVIISYESLHLDSNVQLKALGVYYSDTLPANDDREPAMLKYTGERAGDPLDIAIYLASRRADVLAPGNVTVNAQAIYIGDPLWPMPPEGIGTLVVDAYDTVEFGNAFKSYLGTNSNLQRIEAVSRVSETLDIAGGNPYDSSDDKLPYADNADAVFLVWTEPPEATDPGQTKAYLLRGPFILALAEELARAENAPLPVVTAPPLEEEEEVPVPAREAAEEIEAKYPGLLRLPVPDDPALASDIELRKVAEHFLELEKNLKAYQDRAMAVLNERAGEWRDLRWDAAGIGAFEQQLAEDPALAVWMSHAFDFAWTAKARCGHSAAFSRGVVLTNFVQRPPATATAYVVIRKYLDAKLASMSGG
ncbi:MAG: hypothetical protein JW741_16340, partial [Sedimentisphaerales bacterium]|nr:hypothetical protein [Sedimentisphaerales bacterium]